MPNELVPVNMLSALQGWSTLTSREQALVEKETKALGEALIGYGRSRLAIGEHLTRVREVLEPKQLFSKYLAAYNLKRSTAYKHMTSYENASRSLPEPVLRVAMARNMNMLGDSPDQPLGVYTDVTKRLPPPRTEDPKKIHEYLDTVEEARLKKKRNVRKSRQMEEIEYDADVLLKECYRFIDSRLQKLPSRGRARRQWMDRLVGMMLTRIGVSGSHSFEAEGIPADFPAVVGRPRQDSAA